MASKDDLRVQRANTVINSKSKKHEKTLTRAINKVVRAISSEFPGIRLGLETQWLLKDVVENMRRAFPDVDFHHYFENTSMRPDGGILSVIDEDNHLFPILIAEKKNQGTNDLRALEGKPRQPKGNAIERLGKNVIGFRTALKTETIFPFVCFGDGCDFAEDSSILDRVVTIAQFGSLNIEHLHNQGGCGEFDRGTFYFRVEEWTEYEMAALSFSIAKRSVYYYFSKYGEHRFFDAAAPAEATDAAPA